MERLTGNRVKISELDHQWVEDILYFDGPILSLLKESTTQDLFYYWCDSNELYNRWMIIPVNRTIITDYKNQRISLLQLVQLSHSVRLVNLNTEGKPARAWEVLVDQLPEAYLPPKESIFDPALCPSPDGSLLETPSEYALNLDGKWFLEDLVLVPKLYSQLYSFVYTVINLKKDSVRSNAKKIFGNYPWRGGFSTVNFFNDLDRVIPSLHEPQVKSLQYASPGSIKLELLTEVSASLKHSLDTSHRNRETLHELNKEISSFIRTKKLSKIRGNDPSITFDNETKIFLADKIEPFSSALGLDNYLEDIRKLSRNDLVAIKILMSIYRRSKQVFDFKSKEMISF
ncbi:MAG: hypothetical protein RPU34_10140 [Candidatus Sedimenticola sp. (ex Thyasira tokunagai)]